jgi:DNA-binding XRE family transcriptional regulator
MNAPTDYQVIEYNGAPAFVLVPVAQFEAIRPLLERQAMRDSIPHAVVEAHIMRGAPMVRAWREHLGLTQARVAERAGMAQAAIARIERGESMPRAATLTKLAAAMGLTVEQLAA